MGIVNVLLLIRPAVRRYLSAMSEGMGLTLQIIEMRMFSPCLGRWDMPSREGCTD